MEEKKESQGQKQARITAMIGLGAMLGAALNETPPQKSRPGNVPRIPFSHTANGAGEVARRAVAIQTGKLLTTAQMQDLKSQPPKTVKTKKAKFAKRSRR